MDQMQWVPRHLRKQMMAKGLSIPTDPDDIKRIKQQSEARLKQTIQQETQAQRQRLYDRDSLTGGINRSFTFDEWQPTVQPNPQAVAIADKLKRQGIWIAKQLETSNFNITMAGGAGVGKTSMALAILDAIKSFKTTMFVSSTELAEVMRNQFANEINKQRAEHIERSMREVDVLVIDDFGTEAKMSSRDSEATEFIQRVFFTVSEARQGKTTIITTNNSRQELQAIYNDKIISRLISKDKLHQMDFTSLNDARSN